MASPVIDGETLRFGRLLHYSGVAVVLVCGAVGYSGLYSPVERNIFETSLQIDALAQSRKNAVVIRQEHERLTSRLEDIAVRFADLQGRVPENAEAGSFLKYVSEIAEQENLAISNFRPGKTTEDDGFTAMEVFLDGSGSFAGICSFFDRLSRIQRLSKVKDVTVTVDRLSEDYPMKATIMIYFGLDAEGSKPSKQGVRRG